MIKHIVMFKLKDVDRKAKQGNLIELRKRLDSLKNGIKEIKLLETGVNTSTRPVAYDLVLRTEFNSKTDLQKYIDHPDHQEVVKYLEKVNDKVVVVDYEA